jgi:hypothetical protein
MCVYGATFHLIHHLLSRTRTGLDAHRIIVQTVNKILTLDEWKYLRTHVCWRRQLKRWMQLVQVIWTVHDSQLI